MKTYREIIQAELTRRDMSRYRLAQLSGLKTRTVQWFLSGVNDTSTERLRAMAEALGLELVPKRQRRKRQDK